MPRTTYGLQTKGRVKRLLEALLSFVNYELDECDHIDLRFSWKNEDSPNPQLLVRTKLRALQELTRKNRHNESLTKLQIREALHLMENFLQILEDHRVQKRGSEDWHFTLRLWSKNKADNLKHFELEWERKRPNKSIEQQKSITDALGISEFKVSVESPINLKRDWGDSPDPSPCFVGRTEELKNLAHWMVHDRCRIVAILGMGGSGKTWLSARLGRGGIGKSELSLQIARGIQDDFEYVIWRSLIGAPPLEEILIDLIKFLSDQKEFLLPEDTDRKVSRLIHYLQQHRCLLILDNVEKILQASKVAGYFRSDYEGYGELFRQIGRRSHQSCLLLNSREKPQEIALLENQEQLVRSLELGGLRKTETQELFERLNPLSNSQKVKTSNQEWEKLTELYNGNPLALRLTAKLIQGLFCSDVSHFLGIGQKAFIDIQGLLHEHFTRLTDEEKEVMYWLAISIEPITLSELISNLVSSSSKKSVTSTIESLRRRLLIEVRGLECELFTLQPVLLEYVLDQLITEIKKEVFDKEIKVFNAHALLKAIGKDYLRQEQERLILDPVREQLENAVGEKKNVENQIKIILSELRNKASRTPGYAAGNILNLLLYMKVDLSGYDFSFLSILQAYLQGANLRQVSFAYSDINKSVFTRTFGSVLSVAFSPNEQLLVAGDSSSQILLWRVADGHLLASYTGHNNWVWSVAFSPDNRTVASGSDDKTAKIWDIQTNECLGVLQGHTNWIWSVAFSPNGEKLVSTSDDRTVRIWDVRTFKCTSILQGHTSFVLSATFSPDGQKVVSGSDDRTVRIWDVATGKCLRILQGHTDWIWSVAFSSDGQKVVSGSDDQTVKVWDIQAGRCLRTWEKFNSAVRAVTFSPDGQKVVSGSDDQTVRIWDIATGKCLRILQGHTSWIWSVAWSSDGRMLASSSDDQTVRFWDAEVGHCLNTLKGHTDKVWSVSFSPDGKTLVSSSEDKTIKIWDVQTGHCLRSLQGHTNWVYAVAFSSDGITVVSGSDDRTVRIWNTQSGRCCHTLVGHTGWIRSVACSPDGKTAASGSEDRKVKLWNVHTGQCLHTLLGHSDRVRSVSFSPDNRILASGSDDQTIKLWDVSTGQHLVTLRAHTNRVRSVIFSIDGRTIVSGSDDQTIRFWNVHTFQPTKTLEGHTDRVFSIASSPDGLRIVSASDDRTVRIWDAFSGECLKVLEGHTKKLRSVSFNPDNQTVASCGEDETIKIWNLQTGRCLTTLRAPRPYEGMNVTGVTGLTEAQKITLKTLGAVES